MHDVHLYWCIFHDTIEDEKVVDIMPLKYKVDVLAMLKEAGYTTYRLRKEKLLSESTLQKLRNNDPISWENLATLCKLLGCQPGDIIEYNAQEDG